MSHADDKRQLRRAARRRRAELPAPWRAEASRAIARRLQAHPAWASAQVVALFHSIGAEVDTSELREGVRHAGKRLALPVVVGREQPLRFRDATAPDTLLSPGPFGVMEPGEGAAEVDLERLDLVVLPGLAFDRRGGRLGYGGGYYDRTLQGTHAVRWMVAFSEQEVERVPMRPHDQVLDGVITEREAISVTR